MASDNRENTKTPVLQINGQAIAVDNKYLNDEFPEVFGRVGEAWGLNTPMVAGHDVSDAIEKVMDVNRRLLSKIEILHMRVDVDSKQREIIKKEITEKGKQQLEEKDKDIHHLKSDLEKKETIIRKKSTENKQKNAEIHRLQQYVNQLRKDVEASKKFADEIQCQLDTISDIKTCQPVTEKEKEIVQLRTEVSSLREHLATLEHELFKAKDKIVEQQGMIRLMENDRSNIQQKFQDDLQKVQLVVRNEIENMRDVMKKQWEEMRNIRAQNAAIQDVVADIRKMVVPKQNLQTSPVETDRVVTSAVPSLPPVNDDRQTTRRGGRKQQNDSVSNKK